MSVVSPGPAGLEEALKVWLTNSRKGLYINTPRGKGVEFEEGVTPHDDDDDLSLVLSPLILLLINPPLTCELGCHGNTRRVQHCLSLYNRVSNGRGLECMETLFPVCSQHAPNLNWLLAYVV